MQLLIFLLSKVYVYFTVCYNLNRHLLWTLKLILFSGLNLWLAGACVIL